ncbi:unnamed protein product [Schistosoma margrebowiei]|uniref:Uncharacterized protein n=1 Tax=Schistosoma margrebowiei TaxID=48269 RepID=A0A183LPM3_9TREM|nr:unnamed protein product [Schistosoma margrebowiei]
MMVGGSQQETLSTSSNHHLTLKKKRNIEFTSNSFSEIWQTHSSSSMFHINSAPKYCETVRSNLDESTYLHTHNPFYYLKNSKISTE